MGTISPGRHGSDWRLFLRDMSASDLTTRLVDRLVEAVGELRSTLEPGRAHHVQFRGFSFGGLVGVVAQQRHPGLFQSMIVASSPWELSLGNALRLQLLNGVSGAARLFRELRFKVAVAHPKANPLEQAAPHPLCVPISIFRLIPPVRAAAIAALPEISVPTLFLHGEHDSVALPQGSLRASQRITACGNKSAAHILGGLHHRALLQVDGPTIQQIVGGFNGALGLPTISL